MIWEYDGSFEGFLCCVVRSYEERIIPEQITTDSTAAGLFDAPVFVPFEAEKAQKILHALKTKLPKSTFDTIVHAFLCDDIPRENDLLHYIRMAFKDAGMIQDNTHPTVIHVEQMQRRVLSTLHKMNAYARFETLADGTLYAPIAPPRNVISLMGPHFKKRFRHERFILHDRQRKTALLYDGKNLSLQQVHDFETPTLHEDEERFKALWKRFFDQVAIEERINTKLQRQHVPLKYRTYMHEFDAAHQPVYLPK